MSVSVAKKPVPPGPRSAAALVPSAALDGSFVPAPPVALLPNKADIDTSSWFLSPPGQPYVSADLLRTFAGMSPRDVYVLLCKRAGCRAVSSVRAMLPDKPGAWDVREVNLARSYVGARGCIPVIELCKLFPNLTSVSFAGNHLSNQSVWHICKVLQFHPSVVRLDLSENDVSWTAGMCVLELSTRNTTLQHIELGGTLIKPKVVAAINGQIRKNMIAGSRQSRRGPNPSNHPMTIRQRALKRTFRDLLAREGTQEEGLVPRGCIADGLKESFKLMGRESEAEYRSPAFFERAVARAGGSDYVSWECFMLLVMLDDVTFSPALVEDLRRVFRHFDSDGAGYLEMRDLADAMAALHGGNPPSPEEVLAKMEAFDGDETMTLSWDEFLLLMYDRGPVVGELGSFATHTPLKKKLVVHH